VPKPADLADRAPKHHPAHAHRQHMRRRPEPEPDLLSGSRNRLQAVAACQRAVSSTGIPVLTWTELLPTGRL